VAFMTHEEMGWKGSLASDVKNSPSSPAERAAYWVQYPLYDPKGVMVFCRR
jgi:hypothetical protein